MTTEALMNPRERFLTALMGGNADRTPLAHVSALTTVELQEMTGCAMPAVHHDPEQLVRLCGANHDILGFDAVTFNINYFGEPAALGCEMDWGTPTQLPMVLSHPWAEADDPDIPPDLLSRPPIRTYLEALCLAKQMYGDHVAVLGKIMGPFSMVQMMVGLDRVMTGLMDDPIRIAHLLEVAVTVLVRCTNAQFAAGADAVAIGEGGAGGNMLSPDMHRRFLLDAHRRLISQIEGPTIMHICGDITPRLDSLAQIGLRCFNFDWDIEPTLMRQVSRDAFTIMGNVNTTDLLRASPAEIERQVRRNLEAGVDIISPGCAISPLCPNENLLAMRRAIDRFGHP
jgi:[methyl-Co(III) methanol-specific corrinoid protein]:coenzyme M methyltransferase